MCAINVALLLSLAVQTALATEARAPAEDQFVIVPLRVHVLSSPVVDLANCRLTDADALRVIADVNAIWHPAGIHFGLEKLVREPAAQRERFRLITEKKGGSSARLKSRCSCRASHATSTVSTPISSTTSPTTATSWATTPWWCRRGPRSVRFREAATTQSPA